MRFSTRRFLVGVVALSVVGLPVISARPAAAAPSSVTLATSDAGPDPQESVTLTATANESVTGTALAIQIWDTAKSAFVKSCTAGATCTASVGLPSTTPLEHRYRAYLAPPGPPTVFPPTGSVANSSEITVTWARKWRDISPVTEPPARFGAHMAYHVAEHVAVLFGGCNKFTPKTLFVTLEDGSTASKDGGICLPGDQLSDTWVFDATAETWSQVTPSGSAPHKRYLGSMTYDYTSDRIVLFGGLYQSNDGSPRPAGSEDCLQDGSTDYGVPGVASVHEDTAAGAEILWSCFSDTWTLRKVGGFWTWEQLAPVGSPSARFDAPMAFDGQGRPTLVGGCIAQGFLGSHTQPTWPTEWDCSDYPEVSRDIVGPGCNPFPPVNPNDPKPPKNDYLLTDPLGETCILREIEHTDAWRLSWTADPAAGGTPVWTRVGCMEDDITADKLCAPPELRGASLGLDPVTRKLVLFGGYYYEPRTYYRGFLGDTWEFDGNAWTKVVAAQDQWCPSRAANKAWMATTPVFLGAWQVMNVGGEGAYYTSVISCDQNSGDAQQDPWGGNARPTGNDTWSDSWRWDGTKRQNNQCPTSGNTTMCWYPVDQGAPGRRSSVSVAYDHERGKAVLFGGICTHCGDATKNLGIADTWVFDAQVSADPCGASCGESFAPPGGGGEWEKQTEIPLLPGGLWGPAVAEDPVRGQTVLFGGCTGGNRCEGASNQTWVWDGTVWERKITTGQPPARYGARLAWDEVSDVLLLFGGAAAPHETLLSDTWQWDGSTWTRHFPAASPSARLWHGMDTGGTGRPVLFGGCTGAGCNNAETWRWTGTTWQQPCGVVCSPSPPGGVVADQMAADQSGNVLLFGTGGVAGTWSWNGSLWSNLAPPTAPVWRGGAAMAKVDFAGTWGVLLFGGAVGANNVLNDTWLFRYNAAGTGGTWSEVVCACALPPGRQLAGMSYNPGDGRTLLFGGLKADNRTPWGDTWLF